MSMLRQGVCTYSVPSSVLIVLYMNRSRSKQYCYPQPACGEPEAKRLFKKLAQDYMMLSGRFEPLAVWCESGPVTTTLYFH